MKSPYTEYHYSLITDKNTSEEFRSELWSRFDEHLTEYARKFANADNDYLRDKEKINAAKLKVERFLNKIH